MPKFKKPENTTGKTDAEVQVYEANILGMEKNKIELYKQVFRKPGQRILEQSSEPSQQSYLPYDLTRTTPFFPLNRNKHRHPEKFAFQTSWGHMEIRGERLSIYDETVLLALLIVVKNSKASTFSITRYRLCKIMGVTPQSNTYNAIWNSLQRLLSVIITLKIGDEITISNAFLATIAYDKKKGIMFIAINSYFLTMYSQGLLVHIDMFFRSTLKGDFAKALYRFYAGQSGYDYQCYLLTLAKTINANTALPLHRIRSRIKDGLKELKTKKYLAKWYINNNDIVYAWKAKT